MKIFPFTLIPDNTNIDFMRMRYVSLSIAALLFVVALGLVAVKGFNFALDFTGGTVVELRFAQPANVEEVRSRVADAGFGSAQVQSFGSGSEMLVRLQPRDGVAGPGINDEAALAVVKAATTAENPAEVLRSEFVGPQVGSELAMNGLYAAIFVVVGFLIYIGFRFEWKFAVVASLTTLFDVLLVAGWIALTGREFDLSVLAGLLAVMGFSINDTIVVFDRVRENFRSMRADPLDVMNRSINQTLSRTIITSLVFFLSVFALYLFGGSSLQGLAVTQMVGAVFGTLSSIFIACPLLTVAFLKVTKQDLMPRAKDVEVLARRP